MNDLIYILNYYNIPYIKTEYNKYLYLKTTPYSFEDECNNSWDMQVFFNDKGSWPQEWVNTCKITERCWMMAESITHLITRLYE